MNLPNGVNPHRLFSKHFLERLAAEPESWPEPPGLRAAVEIIQAILRRDLFRLERLNEAQTEEAIIRPVLQALDHVWEVQGASQSGRPDYGFFHDERARAQAVESRETDGFFRTAFAVGEAKEWRRDLDRGSGRNNAAIQLYRYLNETSCQWGILTNGRKWRLYRKGSEHADDYYEIDLVALVHGKPLDQATSDAKFLWYFFARESFLGLPSTSLVDRLYAENVAFFEGIEEDLQDNVYAAAEFLARGLVAFRDNKIEPGDATLSEVKDNTLRLLFRLLFLAYAESRGILDISNPHYRPLSFQRIREEIAERLDAGESMDPDTTQYWHRLKDLFRMVDRGKVVRQFSGGRERIVLLIPEYNGGLFDPARNPFLEQVAIGDLYVANAIDRISRPRRTGMKFLDYYDLGVRQLGSIYEGLLEYQLRSASERLIAVRRQEAEVWRTPQEGEFEQTVPERRLESGDLYFTTDADERKASGSYYTPEHVVNFIVRQSIGPHLNRIRASWRPGNPPVWQQILRLRVLDPAMGSGHFLVGAMEYLSTELVVAAGSL